jgi:catechol 2,3-dioxygenase-like lactoylglutathione lyase family enzyme
MTPSPVPSFAGETNIAMKIPRHRHAETVAFYRDVLGLPLLGHSEPSSAFPQGSPGFEFAGMRLWLDEMPNYAKADVWLQVQTPDVERALRRLGEHGVVARDELEPLGDFPGHWISDPAGNVLLVSKAGVPSSLVPAQED